MPSRELADLAFFALDYAADSVIASGGPLVPFCVVEVGGKRQLYRFLGDLQDGQQAARDKIKEITGVQRAAVAWDGYLTLDGVRTDAVIVEASEVGDPKSVLLAQRYAADGRIGNPALVGRESPLFGA